ncbi:MAG: 4Fe-4S binding protein [bacterium]
MNEKKITPKYNKQLCMQCQTCVGVCPQQALSFVDDEIIVDENKCVGCGMCASICPAKALTMPE